MADLKPCPFCGGEAGIDDDIEWEGGSVVCCNNCLASSRVEFGRKENLTSAWNTRVPDPRVQALVDALANVMGYVDTPISRRRLGVTDPHPEWLTSARAALKQWEDGE